MIPNKSNFKFQELTPITGVKPYVLRFWETEFPEIAPVDSEGGQKLYSRTDVETFLKIKKLLFEDKLSIPEAKIRLSSTEVEFTPKASASVQSKNTNEGLKVVVLEAINLIKDIKSKRNW
jgi:DNA-binding transcriptional MerR regulator